VKLYLPVAEKNNLTSVSICKVLIYSSTISTVKSYAPRAVSFNISCETKGSLDSPQNNTQDKIMPKQYYGIPWVGCFKTVHILLPLLFFYRNIAIKIKRHVL
jgi:hypothetical protein